MSNNRDRLIELLEYARIEARETLGSMNNGFESWYADYLIANGVILLPFKIGTHLWRVIYPYKKDPKVAEYVVKSFRIAGENHRMQFEAQALNVPVTDLTGCSKFFMTREEAEKALNE